MDNAHGRLNQPARSSCLVFASVPGRDGGALRVLGRGADVAIAAAMAVDKARKVANTKALLRLDVVTRIWRAESASPEVRSAGLWGVAQGPDLQAALLPVEVGMRRLIDSRGAFRPDRIDAYAINDDIAGSEDAWGYRFNVESFVRIDGQWLPLERGNRRAPGLDAGSLRDAATAAAAYLARAVDDSGRYVYDLRPWLQRSRASYNILRHAGSTFALLEALRLLNPEPAVADEWHRAAERALAYMIEQVRPCPAEPELRCLVGDDEVKIGGNGLALVAIAEYTQLTGDTQYLPLARRLAGWLVARQREDGAFRPHKVYWSTGEADDFISAYYPGEAIFGLARLSRLDDDPRWLAASLKAAAYLRSVRDLGKADVELPHDHWLLYGLVELDSLAPNADNRDHGLRIARSILSAQNRRPDAHGDPQDWRGSFYRPPRSSPPATRAEALVSAWRLASRAERKDGATDILRGACSATEFVLRTRFLPEKALFTHAPTLYAGGYHRSLTDYSVRVDYVQHSLSALLGLAAILDRVETACSPSLPK